MLIKKDKLVNGAILALLVAAIGLGYLIYKEYNLVSKIRSLLKFETKQAETERFSEPPPTPLDSISIDDKEAVLNFPSEESGEEGRARHTEAVDKVAVETNELEVANCEPSPFVARVSLEDSLKIKNTGDTDHTLQRGNFTVLLPVGEEKEIDLNDFAEFGTGNYGYTCDGVLVGVINVIP